MLCTLGCVAVHMTCTFRGSGKCLGVSAHSNSVLCTFGCVVVYTRCPRRDSGILLPDNVTKILDHNRNRHRAILTAGLRRCAHRKPVTQGSQNDCFGLISMGKHPQGGDSSPSTSTNSRPQLPGRLGPSPGSLPVTSQVGRLKMRGALSQGSALAPSRRFAPTGSKHGEPQYFGAEGPNLRGGQGGRSPPPSAGKKSNAFRGRRPQPLGGPGAAPPGNRPNAFLGPTAPTFGRVQGATAPHGKRPHLRIVALRLLKGIRGPSLAAQHAPKCGSPAVNPFPRGGGAAPLAPSRRLEPLAPRQHQEHLHFGTEPSEGEGRSSP